MSHFAVLVIGDNIEEKLAPYQENNMGDCPEEYLEFVPVEEEYRNEYENDTRQEFYCHSNSSFGQKVSKKNFDMLKEANVGDFLTLEIEERSGASYFEYPNQYRCYWTDEHRYPEEDEQIWVQVVDIIQTDHPDSNVCFSGKIKVKLIEPPKEIPLKDYYDSFEEFIKEWAGYDEDNKHNGVYGYWENPNAEWDWYQIGGRYRDLLKLKPGADGEKGKRQEKFVGSLYRESEDGYCDIARKGDIDWEAIHQNPDDYDECARFWELKVEGDEPKNEKERKMLEDSWYKAEYFKDRYKDKETYARCRSNFVMWAVITEEGEWVEKGDMGWFGMSGESHDEAVEWEMNFYDNFIKPLDDDTLLTVVDCHI